MQRQTFQNLTTKSCQPLVGSFFTYLDLMDTAMDFAELALVLL